MTRELAASLIVIGILTLLIAAQFIIYRRKLERLEDKFMKYLEKLEESH
jgi:hypothetical protein